MAGLLYPLKIGCDDLDWSKNTPNSFQWRWKCEPFGEIFIPHFSFHPIWDNGPILRKYFHPLQDQGRGEKEGERGKGGGEGRETSSTGVRPSRMCLIKLARYLVAVQILCSRV